MQPPTEPPAPATGTIAAPRGDESDLYRRHHRNLQRAVAHAVNAPSELIEDACQTAWTILLRNQPERSSIFAWLRVVAIHEAYRLSTIDRRDDRLELLVTEDGEWHEIIADARSLESQLNAREALSVLAGLPERQRQDFALQVAGYNYQEIADITGGRTLTNVNKHLAKARARIRLKRLRDTAAQTEQGDTPIGRER